MSQRDRETVEKPPEDQSCLFEIMENVTDGFYVLNKEWEFQYVNKEAVRLLQRPRQDLLGNNVWKVYPDAVDSPFYSEYHRAMEKQKTTSFQVHFEPLGIWAEVHAYPSEIGLLVHFLDITEQKRLSDSHEQHYKSLYEQNPDAIYSLDLQGNFLSLNKMLTEITGYPEEELLHHHYERLIAEQDIEKTKRYFEQASAGRPQTYEIQLRCKDGAIVDVNVTNIPIVVNEQVVGIYAICKNITARKQAERELITTKERLEVFLQNSADAIWMVDMEDNLVQINPAFELLFGFGTEVLGGKLPIIPDALKAEMDRLHQRIKAGDSVTGYETQRICKDGRLIYVSATLSPLRNSDGKVIGISGTCRDINASKMATEELRETKERLEAFLQNSADAIWMVDMQDRVMQVNPAFELLFGWGTEVLGGKLPIIPEFLSAEMDILHQQIREGHSVIGYETQRICKDGRLMYVSATLSPVRNSDGQVIGISGTCRDISKNKLAEEELRSAQELFESIFNYTTDAVFVFDLEGRLLALNPTAEKLSGWNRLDVLGKPLQLHNELIPAHVKRQYLNVIHGKTSFAEFEFSRTWQDDRKCELQITLSPICDHKNQVTAFLLIAKDITENKKTQEMLIQSEKLSIAGQLAAGLAHEIRNPLTALKGFVQLMSIGEVDHHKYLDVMASELGRIEMIVSELLMLAKPQAISFKRKNLVPILEDVVTLSSTQAILFNVQIQTDFAEGLPDLDLDENQLKQVFINFIKNAIDAMPQGGHLQIEAKLHEQNTIQIRFQDDGIGIPKEHLSRLGEPFYTTKTKGTGLGLMVSKKIIENHKGRMEISSELGVGTIVDVYLPLQ